MAQHHRNPDRAAYHRNALFVLAIAIAGLLGGFALVPARPVVPPLSAVPVPSPVWQQIFARPQAARSPTNAASSAAQAALGKRLYFDTRLSGDGRRSCATCHDPKRGFSDGRAKPLGRDGKPLRRNAPGLWNLAWSKAFYWDGREPTLEAQARVPIEHPNEMAGDLEAIALTLAEDAEMRKLFAAAFPSEDNISATLIVAAIAAYERSLISPITRFDRWIGGDAAALTAQEYRGFSLFVGRAGCLSCHAGWRFTDDRFHDIGLDTDDLGRGALREADAGPPTPRFKTPGLRRISRSAPYMHDGSLKTLEDVVRHYAGGFEQRPSVAANIVRNLQLSASERAALVAFLKTL